MFGTNGIPPLPTAPHLADSWRDHEFGADPAGDIEVILHCLLLKKVEEALREAPAIFTAMAEHPAYEGVTAREWEQALGEALAEYGDSPLASEVFDEEIFKVLSIDR
jgi:hypothetical protein